MRTLIKIMIFLVGTISVSNAQDIDQMANAFGTLPEIRNVRISPDGTKILMIKQQPDKALIVTRNIADKHSEPNGIPFAEGDFDWVIWASNNRILAQIAFTNKSDGGKYFARITRMVAMDWDGENPNRPTKKYSVLRNRIIDRLIDDDDHILMQDSYNEQNNKLNRTDVYKLNINTAAQTRVLRGPGVINEWYADKNHEIRYGLGVKGGFYTMYNSSVAYYRTNKESEWITLFDVDQRYGQGYIKKDMEKIPFVFRSFTSNANEIYVSAADEEGKISLYIFDVFQKKLVKKIAEHEKYDLEWFRFDDDYNIEEFGYFDDYLRVKRVGTRGEKLDRIFANYFPNNIVNIESESRDKKKLIISVMSPTEPGSYYLLDLASNRMELLGYIYRKLDIDSLSPMKVISYKSRDGIEIVGFLSFPIGRAPENLPTIIFPHGQPFARVNWDFNYLVQFLTSQGYAVLQMNHRGSSGYGRAYLESGIYEIGDKIINDVNDGKKWMVEQGYTNPDRVCTFGFGDLSGYAAIQSAIDEPGNYRCIATFGAATNLKWHLSTFYKSNTWDFKDKSPYYHPQAITLPIFLAQGDVNSATNVRTTRAFSKRLEQRGADVKYIEFELEDHRLDNQAHRIKFLKEVGNFFEIHLKE